MKDVLLLEDSTCWTKNRLTTFLIDIPTCLLAELRTHRIIHQLESELYDLSSNTSEIAINANSARAIPIKKMIELVRENLFIPIYTKHQSGMQGSFNYSQEEESFFQERYLEYANLALDQAEKELNLGTSKQIANRLLAPFSYTKVVCTADEFGWNNFFQLRTEESVEPNLRAIARAMKNLYNQSEPIFRNEHECHLAFRDKAEQFLKNNLNLEDLMKVSASLCAKISYNTQEKEDSLEKHLERFHLLKSYQHYSTMEHQYFVPTKESLTLAQEIYENNELKRGPFFGPIKGWIQFRKIVELQQKENLNLESIRH